MRRKDILISILPKEDDELRKIEEMQLIKNEIAQCLQAKEYRFMIADEELLTSVHAEELQETLIFCREAIRENLSMFHYKNEQILQEAFYRLEKFIR